MQKKNWFTDFFGLVEEYEEKMKYVLGLFHLKVRGEACLPDLQSEIWPLERVACREGSSRIPRGRKLERGKTSREPSNGNGLFHLPAEDKHMKQLLTLNILG
jgi:hypothetical protein